MVLGVVGKIGSGKSYFAKYVKNKFKNNHIMVYSCDDIAKELISSGKTSYDGGHISSYDFFTNIKFQDDARNILHPEVFSYIKKEIIKSKYKYHIDKSLYIIESALPSELMYDICDKAIYIRSLYNIIFDRLKLDRGYTDNQIKLIYESQKYYEEYYLMADYIIDNNGDLNKLNKDIDEVMDEICFICE